MTPDLGPASPGPRCGTPRDVPELCIAQDPAADELLARDPLALLIGCMTIAGLAVAALLPVMQHLSSSP